jgi:hypothetical protein
MKALYKVLFTGVQEFRDLGFADYFSIVQLPKFEN